MSLRGDGEEIDQMESGVDHKEDIIVSLDGPRLWLLIGLKHDLPHINTHAL